MEDLGGPGVHSRNGVCQLVAADDRDAAGLARELLALLPAQLSASRRRARPRPDRSPRTTRRAPVPAEARKVYDVRDVAEALVDDGEPARARRRAGRGTWSPRSPGSTAARSAWSPTSRAGSAA